MVSDTVSFCAVKHMNYKIKYRVGMFRQQNDVSSQLFALTFHFFSLKSRLRITPSHWFNAFLKAALIPCAPTVLFWLRCAHSARHFFGSLVSSKETFDSLRIPLVPAKGRPTSQLDAWNAQRRELHPFLLKWHLLAVFALQSPDYSNAERVFPGCRCA